jgi:NADH dehydrogenase [ubiquinone] 1 alpha subcomplex assembly factor 7
MAEPDPVRLVELGPGRGTLLADALRATRAVRGFHGALRLHLVEVNPALRALQSAALEPYGIAVSWHERLGEIAEGPLLLIANELFDALPVHQLQKTRYGWSERMIGLDTAGEALAFALAPGRSPLAALLDVTVREGNYPPGTVAEVSPVRLALADEIARRIVRDRGAALIVDYGVAESRAGITLQAVRSHRPAEVLEDLGRSDLSALVDFAVLARVARDAGGRVAGPVSQRHFLQSLGVQTRAARLMAKATPQQSATIERAIDRLIDPAQMGTLFQVLAICDAQSSAPAGFDSASARNTNGMT